MGSTLIVNSFFFGPSHPRVGEAHPDLEPASDPGTQGGLLKAPAQDLGPTAPKPIAPSDYLEKLLVVVFLTAGPALGAGIFFGWLIGLSLGLFSLLIRH